MAPSPRPSTMTATDDFRQSHPSGRVSLAL
jgi:hypothetical protein